MGLILAGLILAGHGWGLNTGLFLDDHPHYAKLKAQDWSFGSAVDSARLGIVGEVLELWNRHETGLRFFRPLAFWVMKAEYTLAGWRPSLMHAMSLAWHWVAAMLVVALAFRCVGDAGWAGVAGGIFAVHPGQVACTYWVASQTELQVTVWLLLATLFYARYSSWPRRMFAPRSEWYEYEGGGLPPGKPLWLAPALLCFVLALGSRENAVSFLPLVVLGDLLFRWWGRGTLGRRLGRLRWSAYAALVVIVGLYLVVRWRMLGGFPVPGKPYMITPVDPGFWPFMFDKLVLNMLALFAFVPVIPLGGLTFFQARPAEFYLPFLGIVVGWALLLWAFRRRPGLLVGFGWMFLVMLPSLPVFCSPHHLYLPSVGLALILMSALGLAAGLFKARRRVVGALRGGLVLAVVLLLAVGLTFGSWAMGWVYGSFTGIEDLVLADMAATSSQPIRDGDHLFFINVPLGAYYVVPAFEERTGLRDLHGHVLTFSPSPLLMGQPGSVEQLDQHTLRISVEGEPYFAGVAGRVLLEVMGFDRMPREGEVFDAGLYTVTVERADEAGIQALVVRFAKALDSPEYHFFLTSRRRMAYGLDFEPAKG